MKKNKLYTANKWNQSAFRPQDKNLFFPGGPLLLGADTMSKVQSQVNKQAMQDYLGSKNALGISKAANPFSKANMASIGNSVGNMAVGLGANIVGGLLGNAIGGGYNSGAGNAISGLGSTVGGAIGTVNPVLGAAVGAGSQIVGGLVNAAFGTKVDEAKLKAVNEGIDKNNNFVSNAGSFDEIKGPEATFTNTDVYSDGWFASGADEKNAELAKRVADSRQWVDRSINNNIFNLQNDQLNSALRNYAAFGGPIDSDSMGAINYDFMDRYLTAKEEQNKKKGTATLPAFMNRFAFGGDEKEPQDNTRVFKSVMLPIKREHDFSDSDYFWSAGKEFPSGLWRHKDDTFHTKGSYGKDIVLTQEEADSIIRANKAKNRRERLQEAMKNHRQSSYDNIFAFGGDMQTNSADFPTGLTHINAGGSHEENPNDGVQLGVDNENVPNLVEEGETVYENYVFSNRILADEATKQMFHLPKKKDITFADISKKLEKEVAERPNDPISEAGFKAQMQTLEEQQERQKSEMEAERARAAFEALSPEEQTAVMQNAAQQEQMAQQAAQEQAIAEQQAMQQPSPEETAMMQQQMQADGTEAMVGQEAPMMAEGGHLFSKGGEIKKRIYKLLGIHTDSEFNKWAKDNNIAAFQNRVGDIAWDRAFENTAFVDALSKDNPALAHAIKNNYDFGAYSPSASGNITFDDDRGNWDAQTVQGWWGSNDPAWKQVIKAHPELTEDTNLSREQLADYLRNTDAFKKGTQWLQDSENNRLAYLQRIINNPNAPKRAKEYALRFADANGWKQNAARDYETIFNNPSGRAANPGTYWKTPIEAVRGSQTGNFVINDDGTVEPIIGDVPADWSGAGNYSWATPENDYAYNYYRRPAAVADAAKTPKQKTPEQKADETTKTAPPRHRAEWLRYAGLFGPAVGLGLQTMGIGRPDTSQLDAAISSSGNVTTADWKPLGNYLTYRPLDIWYEQNRANALSRATDRNVVNTAGGNRGTAMAGLIANGYNSQLASGNLFRQAQEYNDALRHKVADFNRGTDQFNAEAYNRNSQFNADAYNRARQFNAQMKLGAAREKMNADAGWYNGIYGNLSGLFKGISDIGRENAMFNMLADNAADGVYGNLGTSNTGKRWLKESKAKGGKLSKKKKKGLTF